MERQALLVEGGCFDRPDGFLDAEAHEISGRDVPGAHGAGLSVNVGAVIG